jgi:hypothetical protein
VNAQTFKTTIAKSGSRTYIAIPFNPNDAWGVKQRHHVRGTINGCMIRGSLGSDGESYFIPLGAAWRRDNGLEAGAEVEVVLFPEGPQTDNVAPDVAGALTAEPQAQDFFDSLPTFYRNNFMRWIESAKRPATRAARISEMIELLKAGKREK